MHELMVVVVVMVVVDVGTSKRSTFFILGNVASLHGGGEEKMKWTEGVNKRVRYDRRGGLRVSRLQCVVWK